MNRRAFLRMAGAATGAAVAGGIPAIVASLLAVGAGLMFWRNKSSDDDSSLSG